MAKKYLNINPQVGPTFKLLFHWTFLEENSLYELYRWNDSENILLPDLSPWPWLELTIIILLPDWKQDSHTVIKFPAKDLRAMKFYNTCSLRGPSTVQCAI